MKANRQKGEIPLTIDGKEYVLFLGTNALELLEEHFSTSTKEVGWQEILAKVISGSSMKYMRAAIWAALQRYHPDMSITDAGNLIDAGGGLEGFAKALSEATGVALPTDADLKALGVSTGRPHRAQASTRRRRGRSTGTNSTATPDA